MSMIDNNILIVLHKLEDSFGAYDVASGKQLKVVRTNPFPHEICLDPQRKKIYIAEMGVRGIESKGPGGHTVSVFDINNLSRISLIDTGKYDRPHGVATSGSSLYVTSESTENLIVYDIDSQELIKSVFLGQKCAHMVNITGDGKTAYTANIWSNTITGIGTSDLKVLHHITVPERPEGMVFSSDDRQIYCVCREARCVAIIDREETRMTGKIETGHGPVRIVISQDGQTLYIPLFHSAAVQFADTTTRKVFRTIDVGPHPAGICTSPDGKILFISCEEENMVYVIDVATYEIINKIKTGDGADAMICLNKNETEIE